MEKVAIATIITGLLSLALIVTGGLAPYIQVQGEIFRLGPQVSDSHDFSYIIETFEIPPVRANSSISLIATKSLQGNLTIQIVNNNPSIKGLPEAFLFVLQDGNTSIRENLFMEQPGSYVVIITSYGSKYSIYLSGVWAAFYQLKPLLVIGILMLVMFFAMLYYLRVLNLRKRIYSIPENGLSRSVSKR